MVESAEDETAMGNWIDAVVKFFNTNTELLGAGLVSAAVSAIIGYLFKRSEIIDTKRFEFIFDQRKKLRELIGSHKGRILSPSTSLSRRFQNLYLNHDKGWLIVEKDYYLKAGYYFASMVYRFLYVFSMIRQLEKEALLLDTKIAKREDFLFMNYISALLWVMTDVALFKDLEYDNREQKDHFFSDNFRFYCDECIQNKQFISWETFRKKYLGNEDLFPVYEYFNSLQKIEKRLRWDRLVCLNMLLLSFINSFGYKRQYSSQKIFDDVATNIVKKKTIQNLIDNLHLHGLSNDREAIKIVRAARKRMEVEDSSQVGTVH